MDAVLIVVVMVATLLAAALTVPAGFGLATMLTPIMLLWLDPHLAIASVAAIHAAHNGWKLLLLKTHLDVSAVKRYGWAMVLGALIGASMSTNIDQKPLLIVVGFALILLPLLSATERWTSYRLPEAEDRWGGFGSGLMGGLTGHQGALRAMFLQRRLPDKSAYAATAALLALIVDLSRLPVYLYSDGADLIEFLPLIAGSVLCAIIGVHLGKRWLIRWKKTHIRTMILYGIVASGFLYIIEGFRM
jgi:uncharacterized membrane protein YfcA